MRFVSGNVVMEGGTGSTMVVIVLRALRRPWRPTKVARGTDPGAEAPFHAIPSEGLKRMELSEEILRTGGSAKTL